MFELFILSIKNMEIKTKSKGAELTSIKYNGKERLHDGKSFWNRHAPVLFPVVGKLKNNEYLYDSVKYSLNQHGFARDLDFTELAPNSYILKSSEETLKRYPFEFELYIWYEVNENKLTFNYKVKNPSKDKSMYFGIGGHPAFLCNYSSEKYSIEFEKEEDEMEIHLIEEGKGIIKDKKEDINLYMSDKKTLKIKKNTFDKDALILCKLKSKSMKLKEENNDCLKFNFDDFKYIGLWTKTGEAPFVCFEPWMNTADWQSDTGKLDEKKDIIKLEPNKEFTCKYSVEFY